MKLTLFSILSLFSTAALAAAPIFTVEGLVQSVVILIIAGIIVGLLYFLIDRAPFIPAEFKTGIKYFLLFIVVLFVIGILLRLIGHPII